MKKTRQNMPAPKLTDEERMEKEEYNQFPLVKANFVLMAVSAAVIVMGFILMAGGGAEGDEFNPEVFSVSRVVVGPTLAFLGFLAMGFAIMWPGRKKKK